ncbi:MAG TPA: hypothetical protein VLV83_23190 [Acidobacteriota bacterium]|nr:hypothetical protein [Acidobacteriota bacterium]
MTSKGWFSFWESKAVLLLLVGSVALNVFSYFKVEGLNSTLAAQQRQHELSEILQVDDWVPNLKALHLDESVSSISFPAPKMLLVFSKDCHVCQANFPNWTSLEEEIGRENVLYVATNPLRATQQYAQQRRIADRTVLFADQGQRADAFRIYRVPQTILLADNQVKAIETGVLTPEKRQRLMDAWSAVAPADQKVSSE